MEIPLYFFAAYDGLDRLLPGSDDTTINAIDKIDLDNRMEIDILDIACGVGSSTILLAKHFENSTVEAFDLFRHYVEKLDEKIALNNLEDRVFSYCMDMRDPDFANEEFDVVFCEAAIEIIGFERGLSEWKRLLKSNGYMVVSDICWLKSPSAESRNLWKNAYAEIDTIENKILRIESEGYEFIGHVVVPENDWNDYHKRLERNLDSLNNDKSARAFVEQLRKEIQTYRSNTGDYSYVFFVMKKVK